MKLTVHHRADFVLAVVMWLIAGLIYPLTNDTAESSDSGPAILLTFGGFFVVSLTRLGLALGSRPRRRAPLLTVTPTLMAFAAGGAIWQAQGGPAAAFPSPSESLYVTAYLGFVAFVVVGGTAPGRRRNERAAVMAISVTAVGAAFFVALTILTGTLFNVGILPVLLESWFLLVDFFLLAVVLVQTVMGTRDGRSVSTWQVATACVCLAVSDYLVSVRLVPGRYNTGALSYTLAAVAFALMVESAISTARRPWSRA